jgi:hypothetical protein
MPLTADDKLLPYEILGVIGVGRGEVCKASDPRGLGAMLLKLPRSSSANALSRKLGRLPH